MSVSTSRPEAAVIETPDVPGRKTKPGLSKRKTIVRVEEATPCKSLLLPSVITISPKGTIRPEQAEAVGAVILTPVAVVKFQNVVEVSPAKSFDAPSSKTFDPILTV